MVQDGEKFILSRNEEQRLKNLANGSDEDDYESSGEEKSGDDNHEDDDNQPTRFEAGRITSGRRVTQFVLLQARKNPRRFQSQTLLKLHVFSIDSFQ